MSPKKDRDISEITVIKRNGETETFNIDKIHAMVERACEGISGVSVSDVEIQAHLSFFDGITSLEIHRALIKAATDLITEQSPNYQIVAGRLLNYDIRKTAWGGMTPPRLYDHVKNMVKQNFYTKDLLDFYSEEMWDKMEIFVDHDRDLKMPHIAVKEYMTKYAIRDRSLDDIVPLETPQITYILVSALMCSDSKNLKDIKSYYDDVSNHNVSLPTPIMAGMRSPIKQFSSCVLIECDDNLNSITATSGAIVKYISKKAGIGIGASAIRAEGSKVGDGSIKHTGVIPYFRLFESSVKSCSQGGVRGGAATLYTMLWHYEIEDVLVLKNNKGTPDNRVRKIDYGIQINNYLYRRLINGEDITLFSPHEVRDLYDAFFADQELFAKLYEKYERSTKIRKKTIPAKELFSKLMIERKDTGRIYIFNVDNVNSHSSFTVPIKMSNLCAEITLPTKPLNNILDEEGRIALCTLSAFNLGNIKSLDDIEGWAKNAVRGLDNLLTYQEYVVPAAYNSTQEFRPLGIGVINLAYYLAKNGLKYNDPEAWQLLHDTMEAIQFYCIKASVELAMEKGPCKSLAQTKYGQGLLPIDHYNKNVDEIVKPVYKQDWEWLREQVKKYGIRNATLTAVMPAETSAKISNSTNGVEPVRALVTVKGNKANISKQVVPDINRLKNKYDLLWDMKTMDGIIKCMAIIQKFTDQSISTNLSYNPQHFPNGEIPMSVMLRDILLANKYGLKTLYYHNTNDNRDEDLQDKTTSVTIETSEVTSEADKENCDSCVL
jgi:ribonucleoside-diphosphate reductase alpha chain